MLFPANFSRKPYFTAAAADPKLTYLHHCYTSEQISLKRAGNTNNDLQEGKKKSTRKNPMFHNFWVGF
jgi:hypothetical protein